MYLLFAKTVTESIIGDVLCSDCNEMYDEAVSVTSGIGMLWVVAQLFEVCSAKNAENCRKMPENENRFTIFNFL
jgi:hypothetical protein